MSSRTMFRNKDKQQFLMLYIYIYCHRTNCREIATTDRTESVRLAT